MKEFHQVVDVVQAEEILGFPPVVIHPGNVAQVYGENYGGEADLDLFLHIEVKHSLLYKFVEDYQGRLRLFCQKADDLVFLARFPTVLSSLPFARSDLPRPCSYWDSVKDLKTVLRAKA